MAQKIAKSSQQTAEIKDEGIAPVINSSPLERALRKADEIKAKVRQMKLDEEKKRQQENLEHNISDARRRFKEMYCVLWERFIKIDPSSAMSFTDEELAAVTELVVKKAKVRLIRNLILWFVFLGVSAYFSFWTWPAYTIIVFLLSRCDEVTDSPAWQKISTTNLEFVFTYSYLKNKCAEDPSEVLRLRPTHY